MLPGIIMSVMAKLMKFIAMLVAVPAGLYGIILLLNMSPDGPHNSLTAYILGFYALVLAVMCLIPNPVLIRTKGIASISLLFLLSPYVVLACFVVSWINGEGFVSFITSGGLVPLIGYSSIALPAPLSLALAKAADKRIHTDAASSAAEGEIS